MLRQKVVYKKWPVPFVGRFLGTEVICNICLSLQTELPFPEKKNAKKKKKNFYLERNRDFSGLNACLVTFIIQKQCVFQQNVINISETKE